MTADENFFKKLQFKQNLLSIYLLLEWLFPEEKIKRNLRESGILIKMTCKDSRIYCQFNNFYLQSPSLKMLPFSPKVFW